ncbi:MAG: hypothetical protein ACLVGL_01770 [Waltera sp.]
METCCGKTVAETINSTRVEQQRAGDQQPNYVRKNIFASASAPCNLIPARAFYYNGRKSAPERYL